MTNQPMSDERISEIKEMLREITPGSWDYDQLDEIVYWNDDLNKPHSICDLSDVVQTDTDGFFIAAAPDIIGELLAENERLSAVLTAMLRALQSAQT